MPCPWGHKTWCKQSQIFEVAYRESTKVMRSFLIRHSCCIWTWLFYANHPKTTIFLLNVLSFPCGHLALSSKSWAKESAKSSKNLGKIWTGTDVNVSVWWSLSIAAKPLAFFFHTLKSFTYWETSENDGLPTDPWPLSLHDIQPWRRQWPEHLNLLAYPLGDK